MKRTIFSLFALLTGLSAGAQSPKAYFPLNGNVKDTTGNTSGASKSGAVYTSDRYGNANSALKFDGSKIEYVNLNDSFTSRSITISIWLKPDSVTPVLSPSIFLSNLANATQFLGTGMEFYMYNNRRIGVIVGNVTNPPSSWMVFPTKAKVPFNKWTHFACVIDSMKKIRLFVNCKLDTVYSMAGLPSFRTSGNMMCLGARSNPHNENPFSGSLDDVRIFDKVLTDNQVTGFYKGFPNIVNVTACNSYVYRSKTYTTSGTINDTLKSYYGCDSFVTLKLKIGKSNTASVSVTACDRYVFKGKTITSSGIRYDTAKNYSGCDSVTTYNIKINKSNGSSYAFSACNSYWFNGKTITASGFYRDTLQNFKGCDSIITLNLTIRKSSAGNFNTTTCDAYFFNGNNLTSSGTYYDTLTNYRGCDSFLTLNLTIRKSTKDSIHVISCNSYFFNGNNLTSSGTYYAHLVNYKGCDSFLTLNLTINKSNTGSSSVAACNSYNFNGKKITTSGIYLDTLINYNGCDSFLTLNLKINKPSSSSMNITACNSYFFGGTVLTSGGTYRDTIPNANGCDSVITLNLTINQLSNAVIQSGNILTAVESGAVYQWLDCNNGFSILPQKTNQSFLATVNGRYAVKVAKNNCTDTSDCFAVTSAGLVKQNLQPDIRVYPNPGDGEITVEFGETSRITKIVITNVVGQTVYENSVDQNKIRILIEGEPGVYFMTMTGSDGTKTTAKLLKK